MKLVLKGLYGDKERIAYMRKQGIYCFDFVNDKSFASDYTEAEAEKIIAHSEWYCKMYAAVELVTEN